jgi:hypothetical protein
MAQPHHTPRLALTEEALTVLFLPRGRRLRSSQPPWRSQLRIPQAALRLGSHHPRTLPAVARHRERTLLLARRRERFFSQLFPGVVGLHPSSFDRRVRKLRRFLEPLRRELLSEMVSGTQKTLLVDSTLLSVLHPCSGFSGLRASLGRRG